MVISNFTVIWWWSPKFKDSCSVCIRANGQNFGRKHYRRWRLYSTWWIDLNECGNATAGQEEPLAGLFVCLLAGSWEIFTLVVDSAARPCKHLATSLTPTVFTPVSTFASWGYSNVAGHLRSQLMTFIYATNFSLVQLSCCAVAKPVVMVIFNVDGHSVNLFLLGMVNFFLVTPFSHSTSGLGDLQNEWAFFVRLSQLVTFGQSSGIISSNNLQSAKVSYLVSLVAQIH